MDIRQDHEYLTGTEWAGVILLVAVLVVGILVTMKKAPRFLVVPGLIVGAVGFTLTQIG